MTDSARNEVEPAEDPLADLFGPEEVPLGEPSPGVSDPSELPSLTEISGVTVPAAPETLGETGIDVAWLSDLTLRLASTVSHFSTDWAADRLHLPSHLVEELLWQLKAEHLVEVLRQEGPFRYRYAVTQRGREYASRLFELCGYVGPAPVALESYTRMIRLQAAQRPEVTLEAVRSALAPLVLADRVVETAALAASSGRSLFLFGPPGNGKTSLGRLLHQAVGGEIWIPHCFQVDGDIVRLFDPQQHAVAATELADPPRVDRRWIRIQRPFIVAGGEMRLESLDLSYSRAHRFYEAPLHLKANGGTFLIDDLGRQQVEPHALLNRWIIPLEHQVDYLAMNTGQKIEVPFQLMLVVATNLTVEKVADPAFLRRMGYRIHLSAPTAEQYAEIFSSYAESLGMEVSPPLLNEILDRYSEENRPLRSSEPRDLIERALDLCRLRQEPLAIGESNLATVWSGYFGQ